MGFHPRRSESNPTGRDRGNSDAYERHAEDRLVVVHGDYPEEIWMATALTRSERYLGCYRRSLPARKGHNDLKCGRFSPTELNRMLERFHKTSRVIPVIKDKFNTRVFVPLFGLPIRRSKRFCDPFLAICCFHNHGILEGIVFHGSDGIGVKVFERKVVGVGADILIVHSNRPLYLSETTVTIESGHIVAQLAVWGTELTCSLISISLPGELFSVVSHKILHPDQSIFQTGRLLGISGRAHNDRED